MVFVLAVGLRFFHLEYSSLWADELATWYDAWQPSFHDFWHTYVWLEMTPPLFFVAEFLVSRVLPAAEWAVRLPAVLFGLGFVAAVGLFAYELGGRGRAAGLIGAAVAATSYRAIYMSQEARAYSLMYLLAALSCWAWLRLRSSGRLRGSGALLYVVLAVALAYTHYYGVVMVMAQGLTALFEKRLVRARVLYYLKVYGLIILCYVPWVVFLVRHPMPANSMIQNAPPFGELFVAHRELFGSSAVNSLLALVLGVVACLLSRQRSAACAALAWVFLPFVIVWLISQRTPIYSARYYSVALAPALAVAAVGAYELRRWSAWLAGFVAVLFVALGLHETVVARGYYSRAKEPQLRETVASSLEYLHAYPDARFALVEQAPFAIQYYLNALHAPRGFDLSFHDRGMFLFLVGAHVGVQPVLFGDDHMLVVSVFTESVPEIEEFYRGLPPGYTVVERRDFYQASSAVLRH